MFRYEQNQLIMSLIFKEQIWIVLFFCLNKFRFLIFKSEFTGLHIFYVLLVLEAPKQLR